MKPAFFWPWYSWCLLGLNLALEIAVLTFALRRKVHSALPFFVGYVAFSLLADVGSIIGGFTFPVERANGMYYVSTAYSRYWWAVQIIAAFLVLAMSAQLIVAITRLWESLVSVTAIAALAGTGFMFYSMVEGWNVDWLRSSLMIADLVAGLVLLLLWIATFDLSRRKKEWPSGTRLITAGVAASILLQFLCAGLSLVLHTMNGFITAGPAIAALIGMVLFLCAVSKGDNQEPLQAKGQCLSI